MTRPILYVRAAPGNPLCAAQSGGLDSRQELIRAFGSGAGYRSTVLITVDGDDLFRSSLEEACSGQPYADAGAVVFEDALGREVDAFVYGWGYQFGGRAPPPMFGLVHDVDLGGYASGSVLEWHRAGLARLATFRALYTVSTVAQEALIRAGCRSVMRFAPILSKRAIPSRSPGPQGRSLHWMYGYSHADAYHAYVFLANDLNDVVDLRRAAAVTDGKPADEPYFIPHLWQPVPGDDVLLPRGLKSERGGKEPSFRGQRHDEAWEDTVPASDALIVSFRRDAQYDYRLLTLAHEGYRVMAPDTGIYLDSLDPICLFPSDWVDMMDPSVPAQARSRVTQDFYARVEALNEAWDGRRGSKNGLTSATRGMRPAVKRSVSVAADQVADSVLSLAGY